MAEAKLERNREIYEAYLGGKRYSELAREYGVTSGSIKSICKKEERREELKKKQYYQILITLTDNEEMITRTVNVLERGGLDSKEALLSV